MPWALGQAVADLFARIAAALQGPTIGGVNPLPPSTPGPPQPPPLSPPGPPPGGVIPEPPIQGTPDPHLPPSVVVIPGVTLPYAPLPSPDDCPVLSLSDRIAIAALQYLPPNVGQRDSQIIPIAPSEVDPMGVNYNAVTIVESNDIFRFRAISTSDAVPVTFFGRIRHPDGTIVPFAHTLTTKTANTVYLQTVNTGPGVLLGAAASVPIGSITAGSVSAVGEIGRLNGTTFTPHTLLFSGQVDDLTPLTAGAASVSAPVSNPTFTFVAMNAAVAGISTTTVTPSTGKRVRICHVSSDYIASAVASNRQMYLRLRPNGVTAHEGIPSQYIGANETGVFRASMGLSTPTAAGAIPGGFRELAINLPETLYFTGPVEVIAGCYGVQAGDTTNVGFIRYEES